MPHDLQTRSAHRVKMPLDGLAASSSGRWKGGCGGDAEFGPGINVATGVGSMPIRVQKNEQ